MGRSPASAGIALIQEGDTMETVKVAKLQEMAEQMPTEYWNDSCSIGELTYAIGNGAVGATSNPTIVLEVLQKEIHLWKDRIVQIIAENPTASEEDITWQVAEEVAVAGAKLLLPVFERSGGRRGRLSIQTNPVNYRNAERLVAQALRFDSLAPNLQIKLPVTKAGVEAIEEVTYRGANINATVSFCVPQALAVAEAVERGLCRREAEGLPVDTMSPVCTIMIGRMDDWIQVLIKRDGVLVDPGVAHWAGIACMKRAEAIYRQRGFRTRLLAAAYRHHLHWSALMGGNISLTIPCAWQKKFNESGIAVHENFSQPIDPHILGELCGHFPDFVRAYEPDGMTIDEFDTFGPTVRTLRAFIASYRELQALIRNWMLPDPDIKR
jgi:transaldolase